MIDTDSMARAGFAEDAVSASQYLAIVDVGHGELRVPSRVRDHLADGPVTVRILRNGGEISACTADLISGEKVSKLTGIIWPDDVRPSMKVHVMCPKGAAGHEVGIRLPDVEELPGSDFDEPPAAEPEPVEAEATVVFEAVEAPGPLDDSTVAERRAAVLALRAAIGAVGAGRTVEQTGIISAEGKLPVVEPELFGGRSDPWTEPPVWPFEEPVDVPVADDGEEPVADDEFGLYADEEPETEQPLSWLRRHLDVVLACAITATTLGVAWLVMGR